jgi:hypothetical protein
MTERRIYFGPYQLGLMNALHDGVNHPDMLKHRNPINVEAIIFSSMIQCGIERFEMPHFDDPLFDNLNSKFLTSRIDYLSTKDEGNSLETVVNTFQKYLPEEYKHDMKYMPVRQIQYLIADLVFSLEHKTSILSLPSIPKISQIENLLPPELLFPIKNLLSSFEQLNPSLPYPKLSIPSSQIARFEQIINSDLFSSYSSKHSELEKLSIAKENALNNIVESGKIIFQKNLDYLQLKNIILSVLPLTAKGIDIFFGKLPGSLAYYLANTLSNLLKDEHRIIIYQFNPIWNDLYAISKMNKQKK